MIGLPPASLYGLLVTFMATSGAQPVEKTANEWLNEGSKPTDGILRYLLRSRHVPVAWMPCRS